MKKIISADNPQFKSLLKLAHSSRERRLAGYSLLDGVHLLQAYQLRFGAPEQLIVSNSGIENAEIHALVGANKGASVLCLDDALFRQLSSVVTPTGVIAVIKTPRREKLPAALESCVMLEDLQDPGNLGSILRTCAAAGVSQIFFSKQSVNAWSPRVLRAAMGAHFSVEIVERVDLVALARDFSDGGGRVIATSAHAGRSVFEADFSGRTALIFGNEGAGISPELSACAHEQVSIPMCASTESLNVAAAAAICLFERFRQRQ